MLSELFPEIDRYWSIEMRPNRLMLGALTALGVGFCIFAAAQASADPGTTLFWGAFACQAFILLGYGTSRVTTSIVSERSERTWDLQRLTPMSSTEIIGGKLLGAPIFAYFLALCLLPWTLIGWCTSRGPIAGGFFWCCALLAAGTLLALSAGLMVSAYADAVVVGASPSTAAALMGLMGLQAASFIASALRRPEAVDYFGLRLDSKTFGCFTALAFGLWALAAARWRVGRELLEGRRFWRLPAFLGFLTAYQLGFPGRSGATALLLPFLVCYCAAVLNSERLEHWKRWQNQRALAWWNEMPAWLAAAGCCALLSLVVGLSAAPAQPGQTGARYPLMQSCFALRDLSFLQWCRFTKSRRPEIMALVFIALAYILPGMVLAAFRVTDVVYFFYPASSADLGWAANAAPGAIQAAGMGAVLYLRWKTLSKAS